MLADATAPRGSGRKRCASTGTVMARRWSGSSPTPNDRHATAPPPPTPGGLPMNTAASVQPANTNQAAAWNGDEGRNWTEHADQYNRATQRHRQRLLDANLFNPSDVALDIGCGTGKAARDVARIVTDGSVVGIDLSAQMLELAEHLAEAEGLANVTFVQGDVQVYPFSSASFDVAIS